VKKDKNLPNEDIPVTKTKVRLSVDSNALFWVSGRDQPRIGILFATGGGLAV